MGKQSDLTVKGQVTIPKDVRDALGLKAGDPVAFERDGDRAFLRKGDQPVWASFKDRLPRARAIASPQRLGITTDDYMAPIREPVPLIDPEGSSSIAILSPTCSKTGRGRLGQSKLWARMRRRLAQNR